MAKRALHDIWMTETKKDAEAAFDALAETYRRKYDKAVACLTKDRDTLLAFYDFPVEHWRHLRTTNPIESAFATVRHQTTRSKGCLSNATALAMIFKLAHREELAPPQRLCPVAEAHPRSKVQRRNRGHQIASSNRCRLISLVTKIRQ
jgi:transposase-like protein